MALKWLVVSVALLTGLVLVGSAGAQQAAVKSAPAPVAAPPVGVPVASDYVIGAEDLLQVSIWKNEAMSRTLPVRPDGKISLPLLHDIHAAGLTPLQLRDKIAAALAEFMPNPEVSVTVMEVKSYRVSVLGEVQKPGVLQLKAPTTVMEALALAGGFKDFASPSKIIIFRKDGSGQTQRLRFNYNRAVGNGGEENVSLKSGDVVVVP
jgi:polysaccharide export outer membrane protein